MKFDEICITRLPWGGVDVEYKLDGKRIVSEVHAFVVADTLSLKVDGQIPVTVSEQ